MRIPGAARGGVVEEMLGGIAEKQKKNRVGGVCASPATFERNQRELNCFLAEHLSVPLGDARKN